MQVMSKSKSGKRGKVTTRKTVGRKANVYTHTGPRRIEGPGISFPVVKLDARRMASALERTYRTQGSRELVTIKDLFQLTSSELGVLFGNVSRQAIDQWFENGVPTERVADVDRVAEVAEALGRTFKTQRLPAIVRGPMAVFDNRSIFDVLRTDGVGPLHEFFRRLEALIPGAEPIRAGEYATGKVAHVASG